MLANEWDIWRASMRKNRCQKCLQEILEAPRKFLGAFNKKLVNLTTYRDNNRYRLTFESAKASNKFLELNPIIWQKCQVV